MPDDDHVGGVRFPEPPTRFETEQFLEFVKRTGEPELYEKLSWTKPDKNAVGHKLLCSFYVPLRLRPNDDYIPCCSCDNRPKYSHGFLVWSPDGEIRIVGSCCGPKYFGEEAFRQMEKEARQEQIEEDNQYYLIQHLPNVPRMIQEIESLRPCCEQYELINKAFHKRLPSVVKELSKIIKNSDGALSIVRERDPELVGAPAGFRGSPGGEESEYETVTLGRIEGKAFLQKGFEPTVRLDRIVADLQSLAVDDALEAVCLMDRQDLARRVELLRSCADRTRKLTEKLGAMPSFFSNGQIDVLHRWGQHSDGHFRLYVTVQDGHVLFEHGSKERLRVPLRRTSVPELQGFDL